MKLSTKQGRIWKFEAYDKYGNLKWSDTFKNLTTNEGLDEILDKFWKGSSYTASHFVGLTDGTPTFAAGDTMASHTGWAEVDDYDEATREALTLGTVSGQSVDNSGSVASFSINASVTVGGGFIATDDTKGGTTGILIGGGTLSSGDRSLVADDTLNVTVTITEASA